MNKGLLTEAVGRALTRDTRMQKLLRRAHKPPKVVERIVTVYAQAPEAPVEDPEAEDPWADLAMGLTVDDGEQPPVEDAPQPVEVAVEPVEEDAEEEPPAPQDEDDEQLRVNGAVARAAVDAVLGCIVEALVVEDVVSVTGLGTFRKKKRAARRARNPQTGGTVMVPETVTVTFTPGQLFLDRVRGNAEAQEDTEFGATRLKRRKGTAPTV